MIEDNKNNSESGEGTENETVQPPKDEVVSEPGSDKPSEEKHGPAEVKVEKEEENLSKSDHNSSGDDNPEFGSEGEKPGTKQGKESTAEKEKPNNGEGAAGSGAEEPAFVRTPEGRGKIKASENDRGGASEPTAPSGQNDPINGKEPEVKEEAKPQHKYEGKFSEKRGTANKKGDDKYNIGSVRDVYSDSTINISQKQFEDPTHGYDPEAVKSQYKYQFDSGTQTQIVEDRIIILNSPDKEALDGAFYELQRSLRNPGRSLRVRCMHYNNIEESQISSKFRSDLTIRNIFVNHSKKILSDNNDALIKVEVSNLHEVRYFRNFLEEDIKQLKSALRSSNIFLAFCIYSIEGVKEQQKFDSRSRRGLGFKALEIPFLDHLLNEPESDSDKVEFALVSIEEQYEKGYWGEDKWQLYFKVDELMLNGLEHLLARIQEFDDVSRKDENQPHVLRERLRNKLWDEKNPIPKTVYYVATFFQNLSLNDFKLVVSCLLSGQEFTREKIEQEYDEKRGKYFEVRREETVNAEREWEKRTDYYLSDCNLEARYVEQHQQIIRFTWAFMREDARKMLREEHPSYLQDQFDKILQTNLYFKPGISEKIVQGVIEITIDLGNSEPEVYGLGLIQSFQRKINAFDSNLERREDITELATILGMDKSTIDALLKKSLGAIPPEVIVLERDFYFARLIRLLDEMQSHKALKVQVEKFFQALMREDKPLLLLKIMGTQMFQQYGDPLDKLPGLILKKDHKARRSAISFSLVFIHLNQESILSKLKEIYRWEEPETFSLIFLYMYGSVSFLYYRDRKKDYSWKDYPLFLAVDHDPNLEDQLSFLFSWLLDPEIKDKQLPTYADEEGLIDRIEDRSDLLEKWFLILSGEFGGEAAPWLDQFLSELKSGFDAQPEVKKSVVRLWKEKRGIYMDFVGEVDEFDRDMLNATKRRWKAVKNLIKYIEK